MMARCSHNLTLYSRCHQPAVVRVRKGKATDKRGRALCQACLDLLKTRLKGRDSLVILEHYA